MDKFCLVGVFVLMVLAVATVSASNSISSHSGTAGSKCMCRVQHPQTSFCDADFVFAATIHRSEIIEDFLIYTMKVRANKVFKGGELIDEEERFIDVYTPYVGLCGQTNLIHGQEYLITGTVENGHLEMSYCNWVENWADLSDTQQAFLKRGKYANECGDCVISGVVSAIGVDHNALSSTFHASQLSGLWTRFHCTYNPVSSVHYTDGDCEAEHAYCARDAGGTCMWRSNAVYKSCFRTREAVWAMVDPRAAAFTSLRQCTGLTTRRLKNQCIRSVRKYRKAQRAGETRGRNTAVRGSRKST